MESKKRKLPARTSSRVEAASKKRTSTPPREPARPPTPVPVVVVEKEPLPKSIAPGKPLPTVEQQQPDDLSSSEYQSIAESRVLAESLDRSRRKWLSEGIFEKYWTKPSKKKPKDGRPVEELKNPPKDSMTKIGQCTITIEPHVFDAIMYVVKDTTPKQPPPPQQLPQYRPIMQYGPPNGVVPQHPPPPPLQAPHQQFVPMHAAPPPQPPHPQHPPQPRPHDTPTRPSEPPHAGHSTAPPPLNGHPHPPPPLISQPHPQTPQTQPHPPPPLSQSQTPTPQSHPSHPSHPPHHPPAHPPHTPSDPNHAPAPAPPAKTFDPVIQMLAERAAKSPDLKALMRIVADGKATPAELRRFQTHIDELTKALNARGGPPKSQPSPAPPPPLQTQQPPMMQQSPMAAPLQGQPKWEHAGTQPLPPHAQRQGGPPPLLAQPRPYDKPLQHASPYGAPPQPQAHRSKGPVSSKPELSCVVFEFVGGNGDRYLFPKYSILEYVPGGQVIASFLIVRKGSAGEGGGYDPALDYYQPVTMRLWTGQGRQLESLARVVRPQEEVRRWMDGVMEGMTRGEYVLLAMRLPRERGVTDREREREKELKKEEEREMELKKETGEDAVLWNTSANQVNGGQRVKAPPKGLSEEERYQNFIRTVS
ncbi:hypothetical protein VE02_04797 [Pseudogymnoascus sp. 03VT05]|nr:hypothetical protein VE02_04797 [Pseudogymnoascus sp. 03VT05]